MDLLIMSWLEATEHKPTKPTYAIQIFSSSDILKDKKLYPLQDSPYYAHVACYVFDDNDQQYRAGPISLDEHMAEALLHDFDTHRLSVQALLVHCALGKNRSPAVGLALNEIFKLGCNSEALREQYAGLNREVYQTLITTAQKLFQQPL